MSDEPSGEGPRGGDGTRSTVEDLRGRMDPSSPPGEIERAETVDADERPLVAAVLSFVVPGAGHVRAGLQTRGLYWLGAWLLYVFITAALVLFGIGLLLLLVLPVLNLVIAVDAYRQVRWWRGRARPKVG